MRPMPPGYTPTIPVPAPTPASETTIPCKHDHHPRCTCSQCVKAGCNLPPGSILVLPPPDPAYQSLRPDGGIWPSTAAFLIACALGGSLFVLWRAGVFR